MRHNSFWMTVGIIHIVERNTFISQQGNEPLMNKPKRAKASLSLGESCLIRDQYQEKA